MEYRLKTGKNRLLKININYDKVYIFYTNIIRNLMKAKFFYPWEDIYDEIHSAFNNILISGASDQYY